MAAQVASHGTDHKYVRNPELRPLASVLQTPAAIAASPVILWSPKTLKYLDCAYDVDKALATSNREALTTSWREKASDTYELASRLPSVRSFPVPAQTRAVTWGCVTMLDSTNCRTHKVVDAGFTTAGQSKQDIWLIRVDLDMTSLCSWVRDGQLTLDPYYEQTVTDGTGKKYQAFVQDASGWIGLQVAGSKSVVRICNVNNTRRNCQHLHRCVDRAWLRTVPSQPSADSYRDDATSGQSAKAIANCDPH